MKEKKSNPNIDQVHNLLTLLNDCGVNYKLSFTDDINICTLQFHIDWECDYDE